MCVDVSGCGWKVVGSLQKSLHANSNSNRRQISQRLSSGVLQAESGLPVGRIELLKNVNVRGVGRTAERFGEGTEKKAPLLTVENHAGNKGETVGWLRT